MRLGSGRHGDASAEQSARDVYASGSRMAVKRMAGSVEVLGRYSNLSDQGERLRYLLEIVPEGRNELDVRPPKQAQRRLSLGEIDRLKRSYQAGVTLKNLAHDFDIHRTTAAELLKRAGIPRRRKGLSDDQLEQAIRKYEAGDSTATIGASLGFSAETVRTTLMRQGIQIRKRRGWT